MTNPKSNGYSRTSIRSLIRIIATVIYLIILLFKSCSADNNEDISETSSVSVVNNTATCSYCGKIIRENGINTHCKFVNSNDTLECDYCRHWTSIKD